MTDSVDLREIRSIVERAVKAAVPKAEMYERKARPESTYGWPEARPLAGLKAALTVAELAQAQAYKYARELRGEGTSWQEVAVLLGIPWSAEYSRQERAYELVAGAGPGSFHFARVYWTCGGPLGCGQYISDHGPYNGYPSDCEDGHDRGCRRHAAEKEAHERDLAEREEHARVMDESMKKVIELHGERSFSVETVNRARYVNSHGGKYPACSTSESLAVALILRDHDRMKAEGFSTRKAALERVLQGAGPRTQSAEAWLRLLRAAATGRKR